MAAYREAIAFQPRNFFAHNNLGVLYDKKGLHDAAIREFETALAIDQGNAMALKNLETARKNQAAIKAREAKILQQKEKRKPNLIIRRLPTTWPESMLSTVKKNSPMNGSPKLSSRVTGTLVI